MKVFLFEYNYKLDGTRNVTFSFICGLIIAILVKESAAFMEFIIIYDHWAC